MSHLKKTVIAISFLLSHSCFAIDSDSVSLFVDPYLGFGLLGGASISSSSSNIPGDSYTAGGFGVRIGVEFQRMYFAGFDVSFFPLTGYNSGFTGASAVPNPMLGKVGLLAGIAFQSMPLRFWIGYNFMDTISNLNTPTVSTILGTAGLGTLEGYSFKAGLGYRIFPSVSFNVEYFLISYSGFRTGGVSTSFPKGVSGGGGFLLLSVSMPIGFTFN